MKQGKKTVTITVRTAEGLIHLAHLFLIMDIEEAIKGARKAGLIAESKALKSDRDKLYKMTDEEAFKMGRNWWWMLEGKAIPLTHFEKVLIKTSWYLSMWQWQRDPIVERQMYRPFTPLSTACVHSLVPG